MKLLIDQNISFRVVKKLQLLYPDLKGVKELGLMNANDESIWLFAKREKYDAIITFDEDFFNIVMTKGTPPKLILLKTGNASNVHLVSKLENRIAEIKSFIANQPGDSCLIVS